MLARQAFHHLSLSYSPEIAVWKPLAMSNSGSAAYLLEPGAIYFVTGLPQFSHLQNGIKTVSTS
jgi:hypothetical protein